MGDRKVLCGVSGGVDSSVVATLLREALPKEQLICVFVNHGLSAKMKRVMCKICFGF